MFTQMVLGHLVGDFLAQPKWMAMQKGDRGWRGAVICTLHVIVYTLCVAFFTGVWSPLILLAVAIPHWVVDRLSIAKIHLKVLGGRTPWNINKDDPFDVAFTAIVYTIVDMTIHLLFLYGVFTRMVI